MATDPSSASRPPLQAPSASIVPHALLYVVQVVCLVLPPFRGRRDLFAGLIIGLAIYAHLHPHFTNDVGLAQPFTIGWSFYMATLAKLLFAGPRGPEGSFWRVDHAAAEALAFPALSWRKLKWAFVLIVNQRGVRWNHQVKNVPPMPYADKGRFLALQAWTFVKCLLVADVLFQLSRWLFFTDVTGNPKTGSTRDLTLNHPDWRWSFAKAFVFGATPYFMLSMQYAQLAFVAVLLGISQPADWPAPFARLSDATTVRQFWGKYWHQQLRHTLTSYTDAIIDGLGIPRGTNWSSYSTLYLAFGISGAFHALSQLQMPCPVDISDSERTVGFFLFFVWQAAAITLEDFIQWIWKRSMGQQRAHRWSPLATMVGYLWVIWSMWRSMHLVGDTFLRMGMGQESFLPFTIAGPFIERYVPVPPQ